jgi:hypothetical protein
MNMKAAVGLLALLATGAGQTPASTAGDGTKLHFNAELRFGKCVGDLCGRFGIRESSGGFGLGTWLFEQRLTLSPELRSRARALAPMPVERGK